MKAVCLVAFNLCTYIEVHGTDDVIDDGKKLVWCKNYKRGLYEMC